MIIEIHTEEGDTNEEVQDMNRAIHETQVARQVPLGQVLTFIRPSGASQRRRLEQWRREMKYEDGKRPS